MPQTTVLNNAAKRFSIAIVMALVLTFCSAFIFSADAHAERISLKSSNIECNLSKTVYPFNGVFHKPSVLMYLLIPIDPDPVDPTDPEDPENPGDVEGPTDEEGATDPTDPADPTDPEALAGMLELAGEEGENGEVNPTPDPDPTVEPDPEPTPGPDPEPDPEPDPQYEYVQLIKGVDYTVSYSKGKYPGTGTATIKGKGKYTGTIKKTYKTVSLVKKSNQFSLGLPYGCELVSCRALIKSRGYSVDGMISHVKYAFPSYYRGATGHGVIGTASIAARMGNSWLNRAGHSSKLHLYAKRGYKLSTLISDANKGYPTLAIISDPTWREHCVAIVGGTSKRVALMDPIRGYRVVSYGTFNKRYKAYGRQSVRISR